MSPKTGRPIIGEKKDVDVKVRIDKKTNEKLLLYCEDNNISKAEAIRESIHLLLSK